MEKLDQLMQLVQLNSSMQLDRFMYTEGKVTRKTDLDADRFSKKVKRAYGASAGDQCWCLLTDDKLPRSTVIGAHLFKWEWAEDVYLLGVQDINDTRNGLPLWKPLEWAYDTSRLCFTYNKATCQFIANILDPSILPMKLTDLGQSKMGREWVHPPSHLRNLTFQHIDRQPLKFAPNRLHRPFKRILNFQARQARRYAIKHNWKSISWDFEDYCTEGLDVSEKLELWYKSMR